jgi:nucleotide-binding universal stress UspA family protein
MFERILFPLDGSARAELILTQLKPLVQRERTDVLLLSAVYAPPSISRIDTGKLAAEHGAEAEAYLQRIVRRLQTDGIPARGIVKKESPEDAILQVSRDEKIDLIAMSTHGRTGLERWMLGSVAEKILRTAEVPLLIVHSFKRIPGAVSVPLAGEPVSFKSIVVPIDMGEASLAVLPWIERLSKVYPLEVALLHVLPESAPTILAEHGEIRVPAPTGAAATPEPPPTIRTALDRLTTAGIKVRPITASGKPPEKIVEVAGSGGFDLLAMATHGRSSGLRRWVMGSIAEQILRSSPIPIFVVPSKSAR